MKLHISLKVSDLEKSRDFYSQLFGMDPTIEREDYVKWDVQDPSVNFVIEPGESAHGLDHLGIQVASDEELNSLSERMRESGQPFLDIEKTTCCYAKMEKSWVKGPNEEKWEAFITHSHDAAEYGEDREHLLASM